MIDFLKETRKILKQIDEREVEAILSVLREVKARGGRLFFVGNGGGAGHASHATCDFRKIAGFEAYCVNDNVSELTARINDEGWRYCYSEWLDASRYAANRDCVFAFSVGGVSMADGTSENIPLWVDVAITGMSGGALYDNGVACIRIPSDSTPQVEGIQAVLWHYLATELAC